MFASLQGLAWDITSNVSTYSSIGHLLWSPSPPRMLPVWFYADTERTQALMHYQISKIVYLARIYVIDCCFVYRIALGYRSSVSSLPRVFHADSEQKLTNIETASIFIFYFSFLGIVSTSISDIRYPISNTTPRPRRKLLTYVSKYEIVWESSFFF